MRKCYSFQKETNRGLKIITVTLDEIGYDLFLADNPEYVDITKDIDKNFNKVFKDGISINIASGVGDNMNKYTDEGFKDVLRSIKRANPNSTIDV